jgi:hypothetical protein
MAKAIAHLYVDRVRGLTACLCIGASKKRHLESQHTDLFGRDVTFFAGKL